MARSGFGSFLPNTLARCAAPGLLAICLLLGASFSPPEAAEDTPRRAPDAKSIPEPKDAALRDRERKTLIAFYEALGGSDWIQRDFWASNRPAGEWHGVETDEDGRVIALTVYDNNVTGTLPPAVCALERLQTLHLSFNKLSGPLPDGLGNCRALKNLWLKGNKISGRLPDSVAVLPELEYLPGRRQPDLRSASRAAAASAGARTGLPPQQRTDRADPRPVEPEPRLPPAYQQQAVRPDPRRDGRA
jgi:hypothetical protein